jgi:hypothetical protein
LNLLFSYLNYSLSFLTSYLSTCPATMITIPAVVPEVMAMTALQGVTGTTPSPGTMALLAAAMIMGVARVVVTLMNMALLVKVVA